MGFRPDLTAAAIERRTVSRCECARALGRSHDGRIRQSALAHVPAGQTARRLRSQGRARTGVVYISRFRKKETDDDGEEVEKDIPFLKEYQVFNTDQCEGLPQQFSTQVKSPVRPIEAVDQFVRNTQAVIIEGGNEASYSPRLDRIQMPPLKAFRSEADHASTLLHELAHWTGHESRLNRLDRTDRFGSDGLCRGGTRGRVIRRIPLCRPADPRRTPRRPRRLHPLLASSPQKRSQSCCHCGLAGIQSRSVSA